MKKKLIALVLAVVVMTLGILNGCSETTSASETSTSSKITVTESIDVIDNPQMTQSLMAIVEETVGVTDSVTVLSAVIINIIETVTVTDLPEIKALPVINFFTADPDHIFRGSSSLLNWSTSGATTVTLGPDIGTVPTSGRKLVTPFNTTTYTLRATNSYGSVTATVTVTVNIIRF
jgi:hypothetical protein